MPTLVIQTTSGALSPPGTSLHQMPCHASPSIDPQIFSTLENMSLSTKPIPSRANERDQNNNNNTNGKEEPDPSSQVKVTKLNSTWTHRYVSPDFKIHGQNFDQHLHNLLMPSERRVIKRALETYESNKDMMELLQLVNSVLDNPHKWAVWYFIVQSMKGKERSLCRRMLAEMLLQIQMSEESNTNTSTKPSEQGTEYNRDERIEESDVEKGKTRIRRRRTMRAAYNREEGDGKLEKANEATAGRASDEGVFRVRRTRRRRTFSGIDLSKVYETPHTSVDILRIEEPEDKETHIPAESAEEKTEKATEVGAVESGCNTTGRGLRRRRRDNMLRRLQSEESMSPHNISMERDVMTTRNSLPTVPTPEEYPTGSLRQRRRRAFRRSLDGTARSTKDAMGSHERAALVVRRKSVQAWATPETLQETHIDSVIEEGSTPTEETARGRRRAAASRRRAALPTSSIDDVLLSENGNNNNANSLYIDEDSFEATDEQGDEDSDMSLKSPISMKGLRASFRITKSKNKDLTELKVADPNGAGANDEKSKKEKKSGKGLLERIGMGKKQQSGSESSGKDDNKSKKLFGKKSNSKKVSSSGNTKSNKSQSKATATSPKGPSPGPASPTITSPSPSSTTENDFTFLSADPLTPDNNFLVRNSTKRLTFSRPPKNSDTEAFLTELSAQFDDGLDFLDDLAQALQQQANNVTTQNFGAKWSYLPNGGLSGSMEENKLFQPAQTNDLSDLNLSDIEDKKDDTPPFPLTIESGDESGLGTMETLTPSPTQPHYAYRDRELEWERKRQNRKKKRRQDFASLTSQPDDNTTSPTKASTQNDISQFHSAVSTPHEDEDIYDVPKTRSRTRTRGASRSRKRAALNRSESVPVETSYPPNTRFTRRQRQLGPDNTSPRVSDNYLATLQAAQSQNNSQGGITAERTTLFDKARSRGFWASGGEGDTRDGFSEAGESLQNGQDEVDNPFPVDDEEPPTGLTGKGVQTNGTCKDNFVYVDDNTVYASPRSERSTAVRLRKRSQEYGPNSVLEGDLSFTDINSLLEAYDDEEKPPEVPPLPDDSAPPVPPPPPPMVPPPAPPAPPPLPMMGGPTPTSPTRMNVKRLNWQKIDPPDLKETVWGQIGEDFDTINDVVKYLDLEQHFATKRARELKRLSLPVRNSAVSFLTHKKAYNTSILLAHLKMTVSELRGVLLSNNNRRLDFSQYKQLLLYAPSDDEAIKLQVYNGDVKILNEADQFARRMVTIPGYRLRLQALMYKQGFKDREEDVRRNLECLQNAASQLRKSKRLAKILEFVLAMGNYMNRGHNRISKATGFKIQFLADMDSTKTSDNKLTFLHILARAVYSKFPELCSFSQDLKDVRPASKVVYPAVFQELQEMRKEWVDIRDRMPEALTKQVRGDRFKQAMESFLVQSNGSLKGLELLLATTMKEFSKTARYFGENAKNVGMQQFFGIFGEFINKFEKADREIQYIMKNKATNIVEVQS